MVTREFYKSFTRLYFVEANDARVVRLFKRYSLYQRGHRQRTIRKFHYINMHLVKYFKTADIDTQLVGVIVGSEEWAGKENKYNLIIWKVQGKDGTSIHFERHLEKVQ